MKQHYKTAQHYAQVHRPIEKSLSNHYVEWNPTYHILNIRLGGPTGDIIEQYTYDQDGQRLKKYEPQLNQTTYYLTDNFIKIVNDTGTYRTTYYYQDDVLVGRQDSDGKKFFYHPDHLGSTDLITDQSGNVVEETTYKPYGMVIDGGKTSDFLYTGKEKDDTGLMYYGARYYDPFFRHFTQPDVNIPDVHNPQSLNRYSYVYNNPYKYVDPSGESPVWAAVIRTAFELTLEIGLFIGSVIYSKQLRDENKQKTQNQQSLVNEMRDASKPIDQFSSEQSKKVSETTTKIQSQDKSIASENSNMRDSNRFIQQYSREITFGSFANQIESDKKSQFGPLRNTNTRNILSNENDRTITPNNNRITGQNTLRSPQATTNRQNQGTIRQKQAPRQAYRGRIRR